MIKIDCIKRGCAIEREGCERCPPGGGTRLQRWQLKGAARLLHRMAADFGRTTLPLEEIKL